MVIKFMNSQGSGFTYRDRFWHRLGGSKDLISQHVIKIQELSDLVVLM